MDRKPVDIDKLTVQPHDLFRNQWMLVTSGDYEKDEFNTMTIGWGAIGTMWSRPFAFVAVRHSRYTYEFMQAYDSFTLTAFPEKYHKALSYLGSHSGRDGDKIAVAGLTPEPANSVASPAFKEAELVIECIKMYADDLNPAHFLDMSIHDVYPNRDYHRIYYGEIKYVSAIEKYIAR